MINSVSLEKYNNLPAEKHNNFEKINTHTQDFKNNVAANFEKHDSAVIEKALNLMLEIHISQKDRPDGSPYVLHPLEIANDIITKFQIINKDVIIAAILHDSIEDQSGLLSQKFLSQNLPHEDSKNNNRSKEENATLLIQKEFGSTVSRLVNALTNKNTLYKTYVEGAVRDPYVCVVKYADFRRNALSIHNLKESKRKQSLLQKYGPVIKDVFLPLFETITESHPLFYKKEDIIEELTTYYNQYY